MTLRASMSVQSSFSAAGGQPAILMDWIAFSIESEKDIGARNVVANQRPRVALDGAGLFRGAAMHALRHVPADVPDLRRDEDGAQQSAWTHCVNAGDRGRAIGRDGGICGRDVFLPGL